MLAARAGLRVLPHSLVRSVARTSVATLNQQPLRFRCLATRNFSLWSPRRDEVRPTDAQPAQAAAVEVQPAVETQLVVEPQPVVEAQPVLETQPVNPTVVDAVTSPTTLDTASVDAVVSVVPWRFGELHELGIASYFTPVGWIQNGMEAVGAATGLPTWAAIALFIVGVRSALIPLMVTNAQQTAKLQIIAPEVAKVTASMTTNNAAQNQQTAQQLRALYDKVGYKMGASLTGPVATGVFSISTFFAVRGMVNLPAAQMYAGGFDWITDLTVRDPYMILPAVSTAMFVLMGHLSKRDNPPNPRMPHMANWIQIVSGIGFVFLQALPAALTLQMAISAACSVLQSLLFRSARVRRMLELPPRIPQPPGPTIRETLMSITEAWRDAARETKEAEAKAAARRRISPSNLPRRGSRPPEGWQ